FEVTDQGVGIAPEETATLFHPNRRVGSHRGSIAGEGLGLYTSRRIAEAHGGTLTVRSELGRGSTFRLEVPRGG
ncbi:MAG: ATP-binding protein, partial [Deltaproteobacteria bacterium]|nr:ATP-binding protein [Deltaproteobacteria bacterium]